MKGKQLLVLTSIILAFTVIALGAYTRLTDAGLGCPDWPGCYGHLVVPQNVDTIVNADVVYPDKPIELHKAWNEMIHRYFASTLGFLILIIAIKTLLDRQQGTPFKLPLLLVFLVVFQGALGMWTVTLNLLPIIVMGHLLGGFTILAGLLLLLLRLTPFTVQKSGLQLNKMPIFAIVGIIVVFCQIALGGWMSANYASLVCTEFPLCESQGIRGFTLSGAFSLPKAENYEFGVHSYSERATMHILHRIGALVTLVYIGGLAISLYIKSTTKSVKRLSLLLGVVLVTQVSLGVSNVVFRLPLAVAVLHNAIAACLLLTLVALAYIIFKQTAARLSSESI